MTVKYNPFSFVVTVKLHRGNGVTMTEKKVYSMTDCLCNNPKAHSLWKKASKNIISCQTKKDLRKYERVDKWYKGFSIESIERI